MRKPVQIVGTYSGSLFALCSDGSMWERVKDVGVAGPAGVPWIWARIEHPFDVVSDGDAEVNSWRKS